MAVRKELLERELTRLGFRKGQAGRAVAGDAAGGQPHAGQSNSHPRAGDGGACV